MSPGDRPQVREPAITFGSASDSAARGAVGRSRLRRALRCSPAWCPVARGSCGWDSISIQRVSRSSCRRRLGSVADHSFPAAARFLSCAGRICGRRSRLHCIVAPRVSATPPRNVRRGRVRGSAERHRPANPVDSSIVIYLPDKPLAFLSPVIVTGLTCSGAHQTLPPTTRGSAPRPFFAPLQRHQVAQLASRCSLASPEADSRALTADDFTVLRREAAAGRIVAVSEMTHEARRSSGRVCWGRAFRTGVIGHGVAAIRRIFAIVIDGRLLRARSLAPRRHRAADSAWKRRSTFTVVGNRCYVHTHRVHLRRSQAVRVCTSEVEQRARGPTRQPDAVTGAALEGGPLEAAPHHPARRRRYLAAVPQRRRPSSI